MQTAPLLFARLRAAGSQRCFYCGAACDDSFGTKEYVKDTFTGLDSVPCPGSKFVCGGCVQCLSETATITLPTGEVRENQKVRGYSWVITSEHSIAATKSHREWLLQTCLNPPAAPFAICISESGQKHLLYRAVVCHERDPVTVTLEGERITYRPAELAARLTLCKQIIAATGKPALSEPLSPRAAMRIIEHHQDESLPGAWMRVREQPLSRLAGFLSPAKDECLHEYPVCTPPETRRTDDRRVSGQARLFD